MPNLPIFPHHTGRILSLFCVFFLRILYPLQTIADEKKEKNGEENTNIWHGTGFFYYFQNWNVIGNTAMNA
jgi:hypothetical protein